MPPFVGYTSEDLLRIMQETYEYDNSPFPLPFDKIDTPKSLLERIEERKLMTYECLDKINLSELKVRETFAGLGIADGWQGWKVAICKITGKSWQEIAPIIYEGLV